ncbi:DUF4365 domain-containing protein [Bacillus pretiosus]|uniref:DUF4365 domain-containing protein n=1 Tax=Bacillus pretiosus TaxID=2983392 RepID=UPI003D64B232
MNNKGLPKHTNSAKLGEKGVRMVESIVCDEMDLIFRRQDSTDLGIDAQIEFIDKTKEENEGQGRLLAVQIKCGESFFKNTNSEGIVFNGQLKHYNYWIGHSLPVILVLCHPKNGEVYWVQITRSNSTVLENTWKIVVPFHQRLNKNSEDELRLIANQLQHNDIVELAFYKFLNEEFRLHNYPFFFNMRVLSIFEEPRDIHGISNIIDIDGELHMIDYHFNIYREITVEDLKELEHYYKSNLSIISKGDSSTKLFYFIISGSDKELELKTEIKDFLDEMEFIQYYRVKYDRHYYDYLTLIE